MIEQSEALQVSTQGSLPETVRGLTLSLSLMVCVVSSGWWLWSSPLECSSLTSAC